MPFTVKYKPKNLREFVNQKEAVDIFLKWVKGWKPGSKALLFHGMPGTGKTALVHAWTNESNLEFIELNASDWRSASQIQEVLGQSMKQMPLFKKSKIFLIDECLDYNSYVTIKNKDDTKKFKLGMLIENQNEKINNTEVLSLDNGGNETYTKIEKLIKIPYNPSKGFYKIKIHDGRTISATGNHLLLTATGWKAVSELKNGNLILAKLQLGNKMDALSKNDAIDLNLKILPGEGKKDTFETSEVKIINILNKNNRLKIREVAKLIKLTEERVGQICSEKSNYLSLTKLGIVKKEKIGRSCFLNLLISKEKAIEIIKQEKEILRQQKVKRWIIEKLKGLHLFPLQLKDAIILAKIVGHLLGDGSFVVTSKTRSAFFSGKEEDMKKIKSDIEKLGFYTNKIRHTIWKEGEVWSFTSVDRTFLNLLYSLQVPIGRKTDTSYLVPFWIIDSNKNIKRAFLSAFFGSEGSKPSFQNESVKTITISQRKKEDLKENLKEFLHQFSNMLLEFDVKSRVRMDLTGRIKRKDKSVTIRGYLILKNSMSNIINFLKNIDYQYSNYKQELSKKALIYLIWRYSLGKYAYSFRRIPYFDEWWKRFVKGNFAYYYVTSLEKINSPKWVYCFKTKNAMFVANNIVVHNCDGLAGRQDLGGVGAIIKIIKESKFPVVLTANDPWNQKLRALRNYCQLVQFGKIHVFDIEKRLKEICEKEKIKTDKEVLRQIAKRSEGDLRSAINDLETISQGKKEIIITDMEVLGYRERETNIFEVLRNIFKTQTALAAKLAINAADKDPEEIFWWIENNIANEYEKPEEIAKAYDMLSKADIFRKRISSRQNWRFKAYMIDLMTGGVATAKKEMYRKFTRYQYPSNIMILGRTKGSRASAREILDKISKQLHCSTRKTREEFLPFLKIIVKNPKFKKEITESFGLEKEELKSIIK
jgi:replication factor C large subunit